MDNLTHGLLGMAIGVSIAPRESRGQAAVAGFLAGEFPDLDVLIHSEDDPLFGLAMHRHFTHSLLLVPVIGLLMGWLVILWSRFRKRECNGKIIIIAAVAAAFSHGLCDVWTSYGTLWLWPFSNQRVAWDWISVIDPLLTLPMLVMVIVALKRRSRRWANAALCWVLIYLGICIFQQQRVLREARIIGQERGHELGRLTAKPSFGNIIVWRVLYEHAGQAQILALHAGMNVRVMGSSQAGMVSAELVEGVAPGTTLAKDIKRFAHFSDGWLGWHPEQAGVLGDLRYALRPDSVSPLWGILIDRQRPEAHVAMLTFRNPNDRGWSELWRMVCGNAVSSPE